MLSGRGLCDELITRPEESYRLWRVVVCDLETSRIGAPYIQDVTGGRDKLLESVPYVKIYRYNPEHLYPKLNGYGDNGQRKVWSSGGYTHCTFQAVMSYRCLS